MKYHNGTRVGTNGSDEDNVPFLPPHLVTAEHTIRLGTLQSTPSLTLFHLHCRALDCNNLPTTFKTLKQSLSINFETLQLIGLYKSIISLYRSGNTVYMSLSTGRPVSSFAEEKFRILCQI